MRRRQVLVSSSSSSEFERVTRTAGAAGSRCSWLVAA